MTSKGQLTIPADIRAKVGLRPGVKFDVLADEKGNVVLRPKKGDIRALRASVGYEGPPLTIEQINEGIGAAAAERFLRSNS